LAFVIGASVSAYAADDDCRKYPRNSPAWRECVGDTDPQPDPDPDGPGGGESEAYVRNPGKCGAYSYWSKQDRRCIDARKKK
jgi:hypothetical protein